MRNPDMGENKSMAIMTQEYITTMTMNTWHGRENYLNTVTNKRKLKAGEIHKHVRCRVWWEMKFKGIVYKSKPV